eukprot:TRINITY_DN9277_c0_g1_i1.p1 TRINITY_DN9277_c0_g1~~TRINITY_DN9277_c0_g1_i1.p1  ORF type:complete len:109 (-),score=4.04 TRINITY_DN9277_c0_g1_i1:21-347(-)
MLDSLSLRFSNDPCFITDTLRLCYDSKISCKAVREHLGIKTKLGNLALERNYNESLNEYHKHVMPISLSTTPTKNPRQKSQYYYVPCSCKTDCASEGCPCTKNEKKNV